MADKATKFKTATKDIGSLPHGHNVLPGQTVIDPAQSNKLVQQQAIGPNMPPATPAVFEEIPLSPFDPYESKNVPQGKKGSKDVPPEGYVPMDVLPYEYANFLMQIRTDPRMDVGIWIDEDVPLWMQRVDYPGIKRLQNRKAQIIKGLEFLCWFYPEYQIHRDTAPPSIDPTEWGRMKKHLLTMCSRHTTQRPSRREDGSLRFSSGNKEMEEANEEHHVWNVPPKIWVGANVEYRISAAPRRTLVDAIALVMNDLNISFDKDTYTSEEIDNVIAQLSDEGDLYGIGDQLENHLSRKGSERPADAIIVPWMRKAAEKEQEARLKSK